MNWIYIFVFFVTSIITAIGFHLDRTVWKEIGTISNNETLRYNVVHGLVDMDFINDWYYFTGVKCTSGEKQCFENNLNLFYDEDGNLKTKQVIYFTNDDLNFSFNSNWYKNGDNIQDLNSKMVYMVVIPPLNKLWELQWIKRLNIVLHSQKPIESEFLLSRFWLK